MSLEVILLEILLSFIVAAYFIMVFMQFYQESFFNSGMIWSFLESYIKDMAQKGCIEQLKSVKYSGVVLYDGYKYHNLYSEYKSSIFWSLFKIYVKRLMTYPADRYAVIAWISYDALAIMSLNQLRLDSFFCLWVIIPLTNIVVLFILSLYHWANIVRYVKESLYHADLIAFQAKMSEVLERSKV